MEALTLNGKRYSLDPSGFLQNPSEWDEDFANTMAPMLDISEGLSAAHWAVILYIRETFQQTGRCPYVFETCRANRLTATDLKKLFPTGYLRGACLLAGVVYKSRPDRPDNSLNTPGRNNEGEKEAGSEYADKTYLIDQNGFLVDYREWDKAYALNKSFEMKIPGGLSQKHWKIIHYLRKSYLRTKSVPTVFQCCEDNNIEMDDLAALFPDGYHRGVVKISGLRAL